jgi:glycosyltransferase involved in cell wall biosynthesis
MTAAARRRVGLLHYTAPPILGGVESTMGAQAGFLAGEGLSPAVIAGEGGPLPSGIELRRISHLNSRHPEVLAAKANLDRGVAGPAFERLRTRIRRSLQPAVSDLGVVLVHNALSLHKNLALTAAIWDLASSGPHWVAWHHDLAWDRPDYASELHPGEPWDLLRRPLPGAAHVAVSRAVQERAGRVFGLAPAEVEVIPPGVDPPTFQGWGKTTRRLVEQFGLDRADAVLLLPSRITRRKNIEFAIRVTAEVRHAGWDARLLITGPPGPHNPANQIYLQELQALARELHVVEAVHFLSQADPQSPADLDDSTLAELYRLSDALLFPSRDEGFGIPVLEAGLARLPVFCSDLPPLRESGGDDLTFFPLASEPRAIARQILDRLEADPASRLARRVRRDYAWRALLRDRLLPLLERISRE